MGITKKGLGINVLDAANMRIKNVFSSGLKVYLNVSGGKDSIVIMSLVYDLVSSGEIDPSRLEVLFIDEEVIYDDVVRVCEDWRKRFMLAGVKYTWATIEHRNNNCFNALENNENFIPWDRYEEQNWARKKPSFAVSNPPYLRPRVEDYQRFTQRSQRDGITITGVRCAESLQRLRYIATINSTGNGISTDGKAYPIYDWSDSDVWKYIRDKDIDFPDVYLRMYEAGTSKKNLRICNLFAIDTCSALTRMFEVYPDLWEAVLRREPNAYLVRLYWDTEMFRRETRNKKHLDKIAGLEEPDYRAKFMEVVNNPKKHFRNKHALKLCQQYKQLIIRYSNMIQPKHYKKMYLGLISGDTKSRTLRSLQTQIYSDYLSSQNMEHFNLSKG